MMTSFRSLLKSSSLVNRTLNTWKIKSHNLHTNKALSSAVTHGHVTVSDDRHTLTLRTEDDRNLSFFSTWLRYNCHSPESKQASSGQILLHPANMSDTYTISDAYIKDDNVVITWLEEPGHVTSIPLQHLMENNYTRESRQRYRERVTPPRQQATVTKIPLDEIQSGGAGLHKWLKQLMYDGKCLVTGLPTTDGAMKQVVEKIFPIQKTIYGEIFDVMSTEEAINVAYTNVGLDYHMDLTYYESVPGFQFLHCLRNDDSVVGGDSLLTDSWDAAEELRLSHPEHFRTLLRVPATFQKIHWQRELPVYIKYKRPHIVVNDEDDIIATHWSPPFEGPLSVPEEDVAPYYKAYHAYAKCIRDSKTAVKFLLRPGDMICFNNHRILHGRESFELNGGMRHLQGCYLNIDEVKSLAIVTAIQQGLNDESGKRVGNHCMF